MSDPMPVTTRIISAESWSSSEREGYPQGARRQPVEDDLFDRVAAVAEERPGRGDRHEERPDHHEAGDAAGDGLRQSPPEEGVDEKTREGQERNQEQHVTT